MRIHVQHIGVRSSDAVDSYLEDRLVALSERQTIEVARVRIERRPTASPPFRVSLALEVPGKDYSVASEEWTATGAAMKALNCLHRKVEGRLRKRRTSALPEAAKRAPARIPGWHRAKVRRSHGGVAGRKGGSK